METYCLLATEYDIPSILRTVDEWLAVNVGLALPVMPASIKVPYQYRDGQYRAAQDNSSERAAIARTHAHMLSLAREYKLKRFALAAKSHIGKIGTLDHAVAGGAMLVLTAELDSICQ